jgi:ubiquinone/menaquinone biosynthesis C-methylase UbiE
MPNDLIKHNRLAYNRIAKNFSVTRSRGWPEFKEFTPLLSPGQRILDWGCGNGRLLEILTQPCEYYGVDQSTGLLAQAKKLHATAIKAGWAHFYSTATKAKKFPANYFDLAFFIASFFHLPSPAARSALLKKTYRELTSGGRLCMTLWNLESAWAQTKKPLWKQLGEHDYLIPWKNPAGKVVAERYYHHFTKEEIVGLLEAAGFVVERASFLDTTAWTDDKGGRNLIVIAKKP